MPHVCAEEDQQAAEKAAADTSALSARVSELVAQLHQLLAEDEAAVDAAAEGVSKLSWEQIQTVQVCQQDAWSLYITYQRIIECPDWNFVGKCYCEAGRPGHLAGGAA